MESVARKEEHSAVVRMHLDKCPLFSQWTPSDKQRLVDTAKEFHLLTGQTVFENGETSKRLYLIISGCIKGIVLAEEGNEAIIDLAGAGQWFGGLNIVDNLPHRHSAIALEPVHCVGFDGEFIKTILESNPALYREVAYLLCERLRLLFNWTEDSLLSPVKDRIYLRLKYIAVRCGTLHDDGLIIQTRISQDVLAAMLGVTRQTLNKALGELKQAGMVRKIGNRYWVSSNPLAPARKNGIAPSL